MFSLMNEISDTYCERFLEHADKQEMIDMKAYIYFLLNLSLILVFTID